MRFSWPISQLRERDGVLLVGHGQVVPGDRSFHVGDASSERCACQQHMWLASVPRKALDGGGQGVDIVSVEFVDIPAEGIPASRQRSEIEHIARVAERLLSVD